MEKICKKCNELKIVEDFHINSNRCKVCTKEYKRLYFIKNKDRLKEKMVLLSDEEKRLKKIKKDEYNRKYLDDNRNNEKFKEKNRISRRKHHKKKMKTDILYRLKHGFQRRLNKSINRDKFVNSSSISLVEMLGCTFYEFKIHIESKWEIWMTWENYGKYNGKLCYGWDIDHIVPVSFGKNEKEVVKLSHYSNLQPLCSRINRDLKRNKTNFFDI